MTVPSDHREALAPASRACPRCHAPRGIADRFCTTCGSALLDRRLRRLGRRSALAGVAVLALGVAVGAGVWLGQRSSVAADPTASQPAGSPSAGASAAGSAAPSVNPDLGAPFGSSVSADERPCALGVLTCTVLSVPVDHRDPDGETMDVRFGVHAANDGDATGTLVIATGGPGTSGIEMAELYLGFFPDAVLDRYDVVLFEQRGVGRSDGLRCRQADGEAPRWGELGPGPVEAAARATVAWVERCLAEAGIEPGSRLDRYGTWQAAADVDAFLDHIGAGQVHLFGESYGTALAQTYAAMRPDRVAGMVLDAVVDPTLDADRAMLEQNDGFSAVLDAVFEACMNESPCVDDFGGSEPAGTWDRLAARLADGPIEVPLAVDDPGLTAELTMADLTGVAGLLVYGELERSLLLRLLAAAANDDLAPITRAAVLATGRDPETGGHLANLDGSIAAFYAIGCQIYPAGGGEAAMADMRARLAEQGRLALLGYADLPCLAGFAGAEDDDQIPAAARALSDFDAPVLILTSTGDPATPLGWAQAVADRLPEAYVVETQGGPHGTFGRGVPCPDNLVHSFLTIGDVPDEPRTECPGAMTAPHTPLAREVAEYSDVLDAMVAVEEQMFMLPDYYFWDGRPRSMACPYGGRLTLESGGEDEFMMDGCALLPEWPIDGVATFAFDGTTTITVDVPGGSLEYESDFQWRATVDGVIDGEEVHVSR